MTLFFLQYDECNAEASVMLEVSFGRTIDTESFIVRCLLIPKALLSSVMYDEKNIV